MKPSEQLRELAELLDHRCEGCEDTFSEHIHIPENCRRCKFESLIPAVEQLERWERALMDLTPGGSEFVGEPETCAKFVSDRLATVIRLQKRVMELEQGILAVSHISNSYLDKVERQK